MTITYQVGEATGGGYLDIDFFVRAPSVHRTEAYTRVR